MYYECTGRDFPDQICILLNVKPPSPCLNLGKSLTVETGVVIFTKGPVLGIWLDFDCLF